MNQFHLKTENIKAKYLKSIVFFNKVKSKAV